MRNAAIAVLREIGVDTGGSNVQFAVNPADGRMVVIEMNPRVSRSSALASKATGFPIAKVAAKLAVGYTLDELTNEITGVDAGLVRADDRLRRHQDPALHLREVSGRRAAADHLDEIGRRGDGDRPHLRRIVQKALRGMETGLTGLDEIEIEGVESAGKDAVKAALAQADARPAAADRPGLPARAHDRRDPRRLQFEPWFLDASARSSRPRSGCGATGCRPTAPACLRLKAMGFSDARLAELAGLDEETVVGAARRALGVRPVYKRIDTCAAEFAVADPVHVLELRGRRARRARMRGRAERPREGDDPRRRAQPHRPGHRVRLLLRPCRLRLAEAGIETIMVNCNPETVSTDYDTSDRLYFEPLTAEDVIEIVRVEERARRRCSASSCSSAARRR